MTHFIYCGDYYFWDEPWEKLSEMFWTKMKEYGIQSAVLTMFWITRRNLITKEKTKMAYEGKLKNDKDWKRYVGSMNDDLESFFENLQLKKEVEEEDVLSFFLPKLTKDELKLVEEKNFDYLESFGDYVGGTNPDVDIEEMKKSNSKSKYIHCPFMRVTMPLKLESDQTSEAESEACSSQTVSVDGLENEIESATLFQSPSEVVSESSKTVSETRSETCKEMC